MIVIVFSSRPGSERRKRARATAHVQSHRALLWNGQLEARCTSDKRNATIYTQHNIVMPAQLSAQQHSCQPESTRFERVKRLN